MKKRHKKIILAAGTAAVLLAAGIYGAFSDSVTVDNFLSMGDVNISLREYERKGEEELPYENPKEILPGDRISKIPRITNEGEPCWIRARVLYGNSLESEEGFSDQYLQGISEKWIKQGEYYYYTEILQSGESAELFQTLIVPDRWTEVHSGQELSVTVEADAIQAVHFQPDFQIPSPWGEQEIEVCIHEKDGQVTGRKERQALSVEFEGQAHRLLAVPEDFFCNFSALMPGDILSDQVQVKNTTDKTAEIFFRTGLDSLTEQQMEFLDRLDLNLSYNGKLIYFGNLPARDASQGISLGKLKPGEEGILTFQISVPRELGNAYALRDGQVKWIFMVEEEELQPGNPGSQSLGQTETASREAVKTGDDTPVVLWILTALLTAGAAGFCVYRRKGEKKHEE